MECLRLGGNGDFCNQIPTFKHNLLLLQKRSFERLLQTQKGLWTLNSHKNRQEGRLRCFLSALPRAWPSPGCSLCRERGWDPIPMENSQAVPPAPLRCYSHQDSACCLLGNFVSRLKLTGTQNTSHYKAQNPALGWQAQRQRALRAVCSPAAEHKDKNPTSPEAKGGKSSLGCPCLVQALGCRHLARINHS